MSHVQEEDQQCQQLGVQWQRQGSHWQRQAIAPESVADDETTIVRVAPKASGVVGTPDREPPRQQESRDARNEPGRDSNLF